MDDSSLKTETVVQAKARMQAADVHTIIAQFVDIHGSPKGKYIPVAHLDDILGAGAGFAGPSIWGTGLPRNGARSEFYGQGDLSTLQPLPWMPGYARIVCSGMVDGKEFSGCSKWFNQQYLRMRPDAELGAQLLPKLMAQGIETTLARATQAASLLKERATFVDDMLEGSYLFTQGSPLIGNAVANEELKKRWKPEIAPAVEDFLLKLERIREFTPKTIESAFNEMLQAKTMKIGQVMPVYRLFVAGRTQGPGMFDVSALLGREEVIERLKAGLSLCRS